MVRWLCRWLDPPSNTLPLEEGCSDDAETMTPLKIDFHYFRVAGEGLNARFYIRSSIMVCRVIRGGPWEGGERPAKRVRYHGDADWHQFRVHGEGPKLTKHFHMFTWGPHAETFLPANEFCCNAQRRRMDGRSRSFMWEC